MNKQRHAQPRRGAVSVEEDVGSWILMVPKLCTAMVPTYSYLCHGSNRCFLVGWMYCNGMC